MALPAKEKISPISSLERSLSVCERDGKLAGCSAEGTKGKSSPSSKSSFSSAITAAVTHRCAGSLHKSAYATRGRTDANYTAHLGSGDEMGSCHGDQALHRHPSPRTWHVIFPSAPQRKARSVECLGGGGRRQSKYHKSRTKVPPRIGPMTYSQHTVEGGRLHLIGLNSKRSVFFP